MKRVYNLLTEILSLPYSELFLDKDPLLKAMTECKILEASASYGDKLQKLSHAVESACLDVTGYLNSHTDMIHLTMVQSSFNYVFNARNMMNHMKAHPDIEKPEELLTLYYLELLGTLAKLFLDGRNGQICVRHESISADVLATDTDLRSLFKIVNADNRYQTVELWNSILRCIPEELLVCCFVVQQTLECKSAHKRRGICTHLLSKNGGTATISDPMLDKVLEKGLAETHLHAGASRFFGIIWNDMLRQALNNKAVLEKEKYHLPFKESITKEKTNTLCAEAAIVQLILASYLMSNIAFFSDYLESDPFTPRYNRRLKKEILEVKKSCRPEELLSSVVTPGDCFFERISASWSSSAMDGPLYSGGEKLLLPNIGAKHSPLLVFPSCLGQA